jgi:hypothetical protein
MRLNAINAAVTGFLTVTSLAAIVVAMTPGSSDDWIINPLAGLTAIAFCFMAFARLSIGAPDAVTRRIWRGIIVVFCAVAAGQFLEGYNEAIRDVFGIDDIANCVLLVVSPTTVWMIGRFDPPPLFARGLFIVGFLVQAISTVLDVSNAILISRWNNDVVWIDHVTDFGQFISLQIYLAAVAIFLLSLHLHQRVRAVGAASVGGLSRYLFVRLRLLDKLRYPKTPLPIPAIEFWLWIAHFITWIPFVGPQVRTSHGKGVLTQLGEILLLGCRSGLDARDYYVFELFREGTLRHSADYLTRFETSNGLFKAISDFARQSFARPSMPLKDRLKFYAYCADNGLPCSPVLWLVEDGQLYQSDGQGIHARDVLAVPVRLTSGETAGSLYEHIGNGRYIDRHGLTMSSTEVFSTSVGLYGMPTNILVPKPAPHPDIARFLGRSIDLRFFLTTCLSVRGEVHLTHAIAELRSIGANLSEPTPSWLAPINMSDGTAGALIREASGGRRLRPLSVDKALRRPAFEGTEIPMWPAIRRLALDAHAHARDRFALTWEIVSSPSGPVLLGASDCPNVERIQRAHREPIGRSLLGQHLLAFLEILEKNAGAHAR